MARYTKEDQFTIGGQNTENEKIETAIKDMLSRKAGDDPNSMETDLDMNSNRILNLPEPLADQEPLRKSDVTNAITATENAQKAANEANDAILALQVVTIGDFDTGFTLTARNEVALYDNGIAPTYYRWDGALPKTVEASSTPAGTGGISEGAWVDVGQASLRSDLADSDIEKSAALIGNNSIDTLRVGSLSNNIKSELPTGSSDISKAGSEEIPYRYDNSGKEYQDVAPIVPSIYPAKIKAPMPALLVESPFVSGVMFVIHETNGSSGYVIHSFVNNVTTTNQSLATTASDTTGYRLNGTQHAIKAYCGSRANETQVVATWNTFNLTSPAVPTFTSARNYPCINSNTIGAELEYTDVPIIDGHISLSFLTSAGSSETVNITINGQVFSVSLKDSVSRIKTLAFPVPAAEVATVNIKNADAGSSFINFIGLWFVELKDWKKGMPCELWGYYRNTTNWAEYLTNNSDNDFVIREYNSNTYGCGYHGGEDSITDQWYDGFNPITPSSIAKVSEQLRFVGSATIDWTPAGEPTSIVVTREYEFSDSGYYLSVKCNGDITCKELYSALWGVNEDFSKLNYPYSFDLLSVSDLQRYSVGKKNLIQFENPTTGQKFTANLTVHDYDNGSQYQGVYVWRVDGSYKKLYYNTVHGGRLRYENGISIVNKFKFE